MRIFALNMGGRNENSDAKYAEGRFVKFLEKNEETAVAMVDEVMRVRTEFESEAVQTQLGGFDENVDILINSRSASVWGEYGSFLPWAADGIKFLVGNIDWFASQDIFELGKGAYPVSGGKEIVNDATPMNTARMLAQNSLLDQRPRDRVEILFYLYFLGTVKDSKMRRLFAVGMSNVIASGITAVLAEDKVEKHEAEVASQNAGLPDWKKNLFSPSNLACECGLCELKRINGLKGLATHMAETETPEYLQDLGTRFQTRFISNMGIIEQAMKSGVTTKTKALIQATMQKHLGAPMLLTRDEMRAVVEDDEMWDRFSTWGSDERQSTIAYRAWHALETHMAITKRELSGTLFNTVVELIWLHTEAKINAEERNPMDAKAPTDFGKRLNKLLDDSEAELRATGFPVDMFRALASRML